MVLPGMDTRPFHNTHTYHDSDCAHYSSPHTLWGCAVGLAAELGSALTAVTDLADATVAPPPDVSEMT